MLVVPASKPGSKGGAPAGGQGPPPGPEVIWKVEIASQRLRRPRRGRAALGWCRCPQVGGVIKGAPGALAQVDLDLAEREAGDFFDRGDQLTGAFVGFDFGRQLDEDAEFGVADHQVDGEQGVEGVLGTGFGGFGVVRWAR